MHLALSIFVMQCLLPHFLYISLYGTIFLPSSHLRYAYRHIGLLVSLTLLYVCTENRFGAMLLYAWLFSIFVHVFGVWCMCGLCKEARAFFMNFMHLEWYGHAWPYPPPNLKDSMASLTGACFNPRKKASVWCCHDSNKNWETKKCGASSSDRFKTRVRDK